MGDFYLPWYCKIKRAVYSLFRLRARSGSTRVSRQLQYSFPLPVGHPDSRTSSSAHPLELPSELYHCFLEQQHLLGQFPLEMLLLFEPGFAFHKMARIVGSTG